MSIVQTVRLNEQSRDRSSNGFTRVAFSTDRALDYFTEKDLAAQSGFSRTNWPLMVLKELVDNSLDASEDAAIAPTIAVTVDDAGITVADQGRGMPPQVVQGIADYSRRVSSREAYVGPCRGAQGNAMKVLAALPCVLSEGNPGVLRIAACGLSHVIRSKVDRVAQKPVVDLSSLPDPFVKIGTCTTVEWPAEASWILSEAKARFLQMADDFTWLNPHLSLEIAWHGERQVTPAADPQWKKWLPCHPPSAHWYGIEQLQRLVGAYIAHEDHGPEMPLREFVCIFDGFKGSAKQKAVLEDADLSRQTLGSLVLGEEFDKDKVTRLLAALQQHSRPVKPQALGMIGRGHLERRCAALGADMETFRYQKLAATHDGVPWLAEVAFAYVADFSQRRIVAGVNWSPAPPDGDLFDDLDDGYGLGGLLADQWVKAWSPVVVFVHVVMPRTQFLNRGKSNLSLEGRGPQLAALIRGVTKAWAKQMQREEREASARSRRRESLSHRPKKINIIKAAFEVMEQAYRKASSDGTNPTRPRQIYYPARPYMLERTGKDSIDGQYFSQTCLIRYVNENPETTKDWDIVWDARGRFTEPHTGLSLALGTLEVRRYIESVLNHRVATDHCEGLSLTFPTLGPKHRFQAILFVEKEGFGPLFERAQLAQRYDIAIMSTKGMSVTAARMLVDRLCGEFDIPLFILRDFDKAGFSIAATLLRSTSRYTFVNKIQATDLGVRLADALKYDLPSEAVSYGKKDPRANLRKNGATDEEIKFLCSDRDEDSDDEEDFVGKRVELNAFTGTELIAWIESKLQAHGVRKVIPDDAMLSDAYRRTRERELINVRLPEIAAEVHAAVSQARIPKKLRRKISAFLKTNPAATWDQALATIVRNELPA